MAELSERIKKLCEEFGTEHVAEAIWYHVYLKGDKERLFAARIPRTRNTKVLEIR